MPRPVRQNERNLTRALIAPQIGLEALAKKAGLDLYSLRYEDGSKSRKEWCVALSHSLAMHEAWGAGCRRLPLTLAFLQACRQSGPAGGEGQARAQAGA